MKKELTIEHLAAYLPYGVSVSCCFFEGTKTIVPLVTVNPWSDMRKGVSIDQVSHYSGKLLLRPLSQLTETIEHNGERFVPMERLREECDCTAMHEFLDALIDDPKTVADKMGYAPYDTFKAMLSWHMDVLSLIGSGLAEPIPSIEQP